MRLVMWDEFKGGWGIWSTKERKWLMSDLTKEAAIQHKQFLEAVDHATQKGIRPV